MSRYNEDIYFYYVALKTKYVDIEHYKEWLNEVFMNDDQNEIFLDLQICTEDIDETLSTLNIYLFNKLKSLDYQKIGEMIVSELMIRYTENPNSLKDLTRKLYEIWVLLPEDISSKEPFIKMNSIDDPWSWNDEKLVIKNVKWLFDYYNLKNKV